MIDMVHHDPSIANARQRDEWNDTEGRRWLERHERINQQIAPFGHRAMDRAAIRPGERLLDVGCGCGETTLELARHTGSSGFALGVDISRLLIDDARKVAEASRATNIRFEAADAQTYPFAAGSFDLVFSRFGIMFFDDPEAAFRNLHSALRPRGRLAFICWPAPQENLFVTIPKTAAARHLTLPAPGEPDAPGPFALADADRIRRVLARSSFAAVDVERITEKVGGRSLDETTEMLLQLGPLGDMLDNLDAGTREAIRADIGAGLRPFETAGRIRFDATAWLVTARSTASA